jgi:iron complex outermembrane receptor protein
MENKGVGLLSTQCRLRQTMSWNVDFNITYNENKITNLTVVPQDKNYPGFPSGTVAGGIGGRFAHQCGWL